MSEENIEEQYDDAAIQEIHDAVLRGQEQIANGQYVDGPSFLEELRREYVKGTQEGE